MIDFQKSSRLMIAALKKYQSLLIVIKGSPDPDAIASSFAIKVLCDKMGIKADIISPQKISLQQNKEMVNLLNIPVTFTDRIKNSPSYDAFVITDHQSAEFHRVAEDKPCAVHLDHHEPVKNDIEADFRLIMENAGSTSTIAALLLKESGMSIDPEIMKRTATALITGIQTDTDKYDHAGELDFSALHYLSAFADHAILTRINETPISDYTVQLLGRALNNKIIYKDWLIAGVGFVDKNYRDSIAITADFLLKRKEASTVIVFAAVADNDKKTLFIDASFRSLKENLNLNRIIKKITTQGGARKFKGAYQIDIEYFIHCPDRNLLWNVIEMTTIEVLKQQRDGIPRLGFSTIYKQIRRWLPLFVTTHLIKTE